MAVLTYSQIEALMLDDLGANVTTDAPVTSGATAEAGRWINDAYASVWEIAGARLKRVGSAAAWANTQAPDGTLTGALGDVGEILHLFASTTAPSSLTTVTAASTTLTSAALFGSITAGMSITGTGIPNDTFVVSVESPSSLTMSRTATDSTSNSRTFTVTYAAIELDKVELSQIHWLRTHSSATVGVGTYATPKVYATYYSASAITTGPGTNVIIAEVWPGTAGYYFPMHYAPQFLPMDATITSPDVNDLESRDIAHIAALALCQNLGRAEFAPGIAAKISDKTQQALARKLSAMMDAKQDK
jgi:hypothetical protein